MRSGRTHYATLGITRDATPAALRRAYLRACARHHPDRNPQDAGAAARMAAINAAYATLSDDAARAAYDADLQADTDTAAAPATPRWRRWLPGLALGAAALAAMGLAARGGANHWMHEIGTRRALQTEIQGAMDTPPALRLDATLAAPPVEMPADQPRPSLASTR